MKRVAFLLKVREDRIEEYKEHHKAVWPEMLDALPAKRLAQLLAVHARRWATLWLLRDPGEFPGCLAGMAKEEINAKWQDFMAPYFERLGGAHADESMIELEEVFHLD